jgi:hypothetical protein
MADGNEMGIAVGVGSHRSGISGRPVVWYTYWEHHNLPGKLSELSVFIRKSRREGGR